MHLPRMLPIRQNLPNVPAIQIDGAIANAFAGLRSLVPVGGRVAIGVGSRGISNIDRIVKGVVDQVLAAGATPFIVPAMGSHGGAVASGQQQILADYGITEESMGVTIDSSMEVRQVGVTDDGVPVYCALSALQADGILLVNRIKPHTDFVGTLGSGLLKMCVIGLGKRTGAAAMHLAATQYGYERVIRAMAGVVIRNAPVLGGIGILENIDHQTAKLVGVRRDEMEVAENKLLEEARRLLPVLPFRIVDLLIIDWMGKNISGSGMDPNVIFRSVHGYSSLLAVPEGTTTHIHRIFVRDLTPQSHGNAVGIGMADLTTNRLIEKTDRQITNINSLTSLTPQAAKLPIAVESDREALECLLKMLPVEDFHQARVVRIRSTLDLAEMLISESLLDDGIDPSGWTVLGPAEEIQFDINGNLTGSRLDEPTA